MFHNSALPKSPLLPAKKRYVPPQVREMGPLEADFTLRKLEAAHPACARRMRGAVEEEGDEALAPRPTLGSLALRAVGFLTMALLAVAPILVLADFVGALHLHRAARDNAGALVAVWIVCCIALALGPGWLLDSVPAFLDGPFKARWVMLSIAINLVAGLAILYRWSSLPPWAR